jgi:hypothetical protein
MRGVRQVSAGRRNGGKALFRLCRKHHGKGSGHPAVLDILILPRQNASSQAVLLVRKDDSRCNDTIVRSAWKTWTESQAMLQSNLIPCNPTCACFVCEHHRRRCRDNRCANQSVKSSLPLHTCYPRQDAPIRIPPFRKVYFLRGPTYAAGYTMRKTSLRTYQLPSAFLSWKDCVKLIGLSSPPSCICVSQNRDGATKGCTCQKRTSDQDQNTVIGRRLSVDGVGAMLYLLEWQVLLGLASSSPSRKQGLYLELLYDGG